MLYYDFLGPALEALLAATNPIGLCDENEAEISAASYHRMTGFGWDYSDAAPATATNGNPVYYPELDDGESYTAYGLIVFRGQTSKKLFLGRFTAQDGVSVIAEQLVKIGAYAAPGGTQTRGVKISLTEVSA